MQQGVFANLKIFLILLVLSCILLVLDSFKFLEFPKSALQIVTNPIQYGFYRTELNIGRQFEFIFLARRAAQENKALTEQLAQALSDNANLRKRLAEAEGFLAQQNSLSPETYSLVPARIMGMSGARYLLIDKGSKNNIKIDQPLVYKDNYIGKIFHVSPMQSKVLLPTDPESKVAVFVSNKDGKARGILQGQFGSELLMDKILHKEILAVDDLVYSEGTEGILPRGLIIGKVTEVFDNPNEIFKKAKVKSNFDVTNLDLVFVITN